MQDSSTSSGSVLQFRQDLHAKLRDGVRRAIEAVLEEELVAALGAEAHVRTPGRRGYRHGTVTRTLTTREGVRTITLPRGRLETADGGTQEFRSTVVPRYARRTREVDDALLGCYFGGVNSRRAAWPQPVRSESEGVRTVTNARHGCRRACRNSG